MIITKTPYRISLFGGGSDFPEWYTNNIGRTLSFSINKYCYVSGKILQKGFNHYYRVVYSKVEEVKKFTEIEHPVVREAIGKYLPDQYLEIHHMSDLPARSGIGSSSAFAVGVINCLFLLKNVFLSEEQLATEAINLERNILKENVGIQDQITTAFGGLNEIVIENGIWKIYPISIEVNFKRALESRMVLVYSGITRNSSNISKGLFKKFKSKHNNIKSLVELAEESARIFKTESINQLDSIGKMLNDAWKIKKELNSMSTNDKLDDLYRVAIDCGALGGKVLGAGGGGFMLFWVREGEKNRFIEKIGSSYVVPFEISKKGSEHILFPTEKTFCS